MSDRDASLWMGDISDYMDEAFILSAFHLMEEDAKSVRIIRTRTGNSSLGYCFVNFSDSKAALRVMHKLNGKTIPNSSPPSRFLLNQSSTSQTGTEYSLWVGDLDPTVDDEKLHDGFCKLYSSVISARVIYDKVTQTSKGYGFVNFSSESDRRHALLNMTGYAGISSKPLRVSLAVAKKASNSAVLTSLAASMLSTVTSMNTSGNKQGTLATPSMYAYQQHAQQPGYNHYYYNYDCSGQYPYAGAADYSAYYAMNNGYNTASANQMYQQHAAGYMYGNQTPSAVANQASMMASSNMAASHYPSNTARTGASNMPKDQDSELTMMQRRM